MEQLKKQVSRAAWRMNGQAFLSILTWWLVSGLAVAAVAIAAPKIWHFADANLWTKAWLAGSLALAIVGAMVTAWMYRRSRLEAAMELDRRFGLRERVSSCLSLEEEELESEAGQALVADAVRRVERVDVRQQFSVSGDWRMLLPLIPAIVVFVIVMVVPDAAQDKVEAADTDTLAIKKRITAEAKDLKKELSKRAKKAEEQGLKDAADLFNKLEKSAEELNKKNVDRKKAMVKLNDLKQQLESRREKVAGASDMKKQLNQLKDIKKGPGDKLAKAMKDGNFNEAMKQIKKMQEDLKNGEMKPEDQKKLAEQMAQMQKKMQDMADAHEQAKAKLEKEIEKQIANGNMDQAAKAQQQLDKLQQKDELMDKLSQMANQMGQASDKLKEGQGQQASQQLDQLAQQLEQMKQADDELEMLDEALTKLGECKNGMCQGQGQKQGQGQLAKMGQGGQGNQQGKKPGMGMGPGQGKGDRPEEENGTQFYDSQVRGEVGPGSAVIVGEADGPNKAGVAREEISNRIVEARRAEADPLTGKRLPRSQRDHVKEYLDSFREGN